VIPSVVRLATTHLWGIFFDRWNFFVVRTVLNVFSLGAIVLFFSTRQLWVLWIAAALFGMALAGGNIAWNLWVTKFAPPERASEYMSVHTFMTGVRGVIGPFIGFWAIAHIAPLSTALVAAGLVAVSTLLLEPVRRRAGAIGRAA
jgi:MFS family permease